MISTSRIDNCFKIAMFLCRYAFATTPCTLYTARLLARAGYEVDIFCYQPFDVSGQGSDCRGERSCPRPHRAGGAHRG